MQHLLSSLDQGGLIGPHIVPLMARLDAIIGAGEASAGEVRKRVRLLSFGSRKMPLEHFSLVGAALFKRRRLKMEYYARSSERSFRPGNLAAAPRPLSRELVPRHVVPPAQRPARLLGGWHPADRGARHPGEGGVAEGAGRVPPRGATASSRGSKDQRAKLRFSVDRARWVAAEVWHPEQKGSFDAEGRYILELPFRDDRELVLDILRHGAEVEVVAPVALRRKVHGAHLAAAKLNG